MFILMNHYLSRGSAAEDKLGRDVRGMFPHAAEIRCHLPGQMVVNLKNSREESLGQVAKTAREFFKNPYCKLTLEEESDRWVLEVGSTDDLEE